MQAVRYAIGIDISTQTVSAALAGVREHCGDPVEVHIDPRWLASASYSCDEERKLPSAWVRLAKHCIEQLICGVPEARLSTGIGISTTFPGTFVFTSLESDPPYCVLYDSTQDAGLLSGGFEEELADAERGTLNRTWPGSMSVGLVHLMRDAGLKLDGLAAVVPPNTAFAHALLRKAGYLTDPLALGSDFTQTIIGGLYAAPQAAPLPESVRQMLRAAIPGLDTTRLEALLPQARPAWTNAVPGQALYRVREYLGLPALEAVSIGAGDSALAVLPLCPDSDTVADVRGSSDTPVMLVSFPQPVECGRERLLHYPMVTAADTRTALWCGAAPILRTGRVWDWVRRLRFDGSDTAADTELERLAVEALVRQLSSVGGKPDAFPLFRTSLGGERAPSWDSQITGSIWNLIECHSIGDIALAALEGVSASLRGCIELMEARYAVKSKRLLLAGGPTRNRLWNWVTQALTSRETLVTEFADASVLGAALLGHAAACQRKMDNSQVSRQLVRLAGLCSQHTLIRPQRVTPPPGISAAVRRAYQQRAEQVLQAHLANAAGAARS